MNEEKKDGSNCCSEQKCCCAKKLMCLIMAILIFILGYLFGKSYGGYCPFSPSKSPVMQGMQK